jgi:hypothetical protein
MKTILRFTAIVALMLVTTRGMANEPELSLVTDRGTKDLILNWDSPPKMSLVKLSNAQGNLLFHTNVPNEAYAKTFDLRNFKNGTYFLKVMDPSNTTVFTIRFYGSGAEIFKSEGNSKPVFKKTGDMVYLNLLNLDQNEVAIKVVDAQKRLVFKELVKGKIMVQKAYNFKDAYANRYTIVVNDGKNTYYGNIVVE